MKISELNQLIERIQRSIKRVNEKNGAGIRWEVNIPDFGVQKYLLEGIKDTNQVNDDVANLSVWIWSLKDHLKEFFKSIGKDPRVVERYIDSDQNLKICMDIANSYKHFHLKYDRSNQFGKLGEVRYLLPQHSIGELTYYEKEVKVEISHPEQIEVFLPVQDKNSREIGDAINYLFNGMRAWENFMIENGLFI